MEEVIHFEDPTFRTIALVCLGGMAAGFLFWSWHARRQLKSLDLKAASERVIRGCRVMSFWGPIVALAMVMMVLLIERRIHTVEIGQTHLTLRSGWRSETIAYVDIRSVRTELAYRRRFQKKGPHNLFVLRFWADGREHTLSARKYDAPARRRLARVLAVLEERVPSPIEEPTSLDRAYRLWNMLRAEDAQTQPAHEPNRREQP